MVAVIRLSGGSCGAPRGGRARCPAVTATSRTVTTGAVHASVWFRRPEDLRSASVDEGRDVDIDQLPGRRVPRERCGAPRGLAAPGHSERRIVHHPLQTVPDRLWFRR